MFPCVLTGLQRRSSVPPHLHHVQLLSVPGAAGLLQGAGHSTPDLTTSSFSFLSRSLCLLCCSSTTSQGMFPHATSSRTQCLDHEGRSRGSEDGETHKKKKKNPAWLSLLQWVSIALTLNASPHDGVPRKRVWWHKMVKKCDELFLSCHRGLRAVLTTSFTQRRNSHCLSFLQKIDSYFYNLQLGCSSCNAAESV